MPEQCKLDKEARLFKQSEEDMFEMVRIHFFLPCGMQISTADFQKIVTRYYESKYHDFVLLMTELRNVNAPVYVMTEELPSDW